MIAKRFVVHGRVQGVGFRYFVVRQARVLGLIGWVRNLPNGTVELVAAGSNYTIDELETLLREGPVYSRVDRVDSSFEVFPEGGSFETRPTPSTCD